jgi:hypothetical protein
MSVKRERSKMAFTMYEENMKVLNNVFDEIIVNSIMDYIDTDVIYYKTLNEDLEDWDIINLVRCNEDGWVSDGYTDIFFSEKNIKWENNHIWEMESSNNGDFSFVCTNYTKGDNEKASKYKMILRLMKINNEEYTHKSEFLVYKK